MKFIFYSLLILYTLQANSQNKDQKLLEKYKISKIIIKGYQLENDFVIKKTHHIEELDIFGNTLTYKTLGTNDSILKIRNFTFSEDGNTEYSEILDESGRLQSKFLTITDKEKRSVRKMQVVDNDTVVEQLWIRDINLNDSILYRIKKNKKLLQHKWTYNKGNMLISRTYYDKDGDLLRKQDFQYKRTGNCVITKTNKKVIEYKCSENNKETYKILRNSVGYLQGIKLVAEKDGLRVETKLENGLLEKSEYFSKSGKLLALITYNYI
jgi:hypothetical protein